MKNNEAKHSDAKHSDGKKPDARNSDFKSSDFKSSDSKHPETKHADSKSTDTKHANNQVANDTSHKGAAHETLDMKGPSAKNADQIKPKMPVVCSENGQFAVVDHVEGKALKLAKDNKGQHHYIPLNWITSVDDKVHVDRPGKKAMADWSTTPQP